MEQPLGAQCSAQEEPGLHIWNPQALEDLAVQTSKEHRGCESGILLNLGKRRHFTQSGDHSQSPENRGLIKKKKKILLAKLICQNQPRPVNKLEAEILLQMQLLPPSFNIKNHFNQIIHSKQCHVSHLQITEKPASEIRKWHFLGVKTIVISTLYLLYELII